MVTGVRSDRLLGTAPEFVKILPSSATHTVKDSGVPTVAGRAAVRPRGP
jgi:hypothetical protein